ncbi:MAG: hypothetical protein Q7T73_15780 [Beijerinckiaceae bacterium]|jgi:hypothetical protein|nr:hypothetical protein [Beijerinckiaceae bacterium]
MEFKSLADLRCIADVTSDIPKLTREEKIEIWVKALARDPARSLTPLPEIEWAPAHMRPALRADGSPLSVAFEQPMLRAAGLAGDRLGDAMAFFELSEAEAHDTLCSCHYGRSMTAGAAARRIRRVAGSGLVSRVRSWLSKSLGLRPVPT